MPLLDPRYAERLTWRTLLKQALFVGALAGLWFFAVYLTDVHHAAPIAQLVFYLVWGLLSLLAVTSLAWSIVTLARRR